MIASFMDGHVASSKKLLGSFNERYNSLVSYDFNTNPFSAGTIVSDSGNNCLECVATGTELKPGITVTSGAFFDRMFAECSNPDVAHHVEFCISFKIKRTLASTAARSGWFDLLGEWFHTPSGPQKIYLIPYDTAMLSGEPYLGSQTAGWESYDNTTYPAFRFRMPYYVDPSPNYFRFYMTFHNKNTTAATTETFRLDDFIITEVLPG